MRFLVDAQLPPALARWLVAVGYDAKHVADRGMQAVADAAILGIGAGAGGPSVSHPAYNLSPPYSRCTPSAGVKSFNLLQLP